MKKYTTTALFKLSFNRDNSLLIYQNGAVKVFIASYFKLHLLMRSFTQIYYSFPYIMTINPRAVQSPYVFSQLPASLSSSAISSTAGYHSKPFSKHSNEEFPRGHAITFYCLFGIILIGMLPQISFCLPDEIRHPLVMASFCCISYALLRCANYNLN